MSVFARVMRLSRLIPVAIAVIAMFAPQFANALYNANMEGRVEFVAVYAEGDYIYLRLHNQPTSHPTCNPAYFVISQDIPQNRRNQMFAALQVAKATGESINIGYDNSTECMHGYLRVHRVG